MKKLVLGLGLAVVPFVISGCGVNCSTYCEYVVECYDCDEDDAADKCEQACEESYDKLSDGEQETADACLECLDEELGGECSDFSDFADAAEDCDNDCYDEDAVEFFEEWLDDFDLRKDCDGGSSCDAAAGICGGTWAGGLCSGQDACASQCIVSAGYCEVSSVDDPLYSCMDACL